MKAEQHARLADLLAQAMELAPEQRSLFLAQECSQDDALRREVESLLRLETAAADFIESPAWAAGGKYCVKCGQRYERTQQMCKVDGELLSLPDPYGLVGKTLAGRYRVEALVGMGGMGAVYSAEHTALKRRVAFKILQPNIAMSNGQMTALFAREAQTIGRITHENVADVKDAGQTAEGIVYLVMEWLEGRTLEDALREKGIFTLAETGAVLKQVCAALEAAHQVGIVHRDLKPSNVMLVRRADGSEQVKVVDFGIAKILGETVGATVSQAMGTPHYASPEQLQMGAHIDGRTDIYSLGVMVYQMLSGRLPFNAPSLHELLRLQQTAEPLALRQVRADVPEAIEQLVSRMLAKDPNLRPQRAGEVSQSFETVIKFSLESGAVLQPASQPDITTMGNSATILLSPHTEASKITLDQKSEINTKGGSKLTEPIPRKIQRRRKWIIAGLTVLSVVAIGVAYLATSSGNSCAITPRLRSWSYRN
jgi:serine/threonine protein kinase